jgi:hypothetical protein
VTVGWTANGKASSESFVVECKTDERAEAVWRALAAAVQFAPAAEKLILELKDAEPLGRLMP